MAQTISNLLVALGLDINDFKKGLADAESESKNGASKIGQGLANIGGLAAGGIAAAGAAAVGFLATTIGPASDLNETMSKVNVVFGESAGKVLAFGDSAANALGMSKNAALTAAGTYGNLFRALGVTADKSATMSTSLVKLAGDLASFNNMDPTEVLDSLRSGLTGMSEPMKKLGVNINETLIKAKALQMGLLSSTVDQNKVAAAQINLEKAIFATDAAIKKYGKDSLEARDAAQKQQTAEYDLKEIMKGKVGELSQLAKTQATYQLIMEQTTLAQGDFARTSEGVANQQRIMAANFEDIKAKLGSGLLPMLSALSTTLLKLVNTKAFQEGLAVVSKGIADFAQDVITNIPIVIADFELMVAWFKDNPAFIVGALAVLGVAMIAFGVSTVAAGLTAMAGLWPIVLVIAFVAAAAALLYMAWTNNWGGIQEKTAGVWAWLQPILKNIYDWLSTNIPVGIAFLREKFDEIPGTVASVAAFVRNSIDSLTKFINDLVSGRLGLLSQLWKTEWDIISLYFSEWVKGIQLQFKLFSDLLSGNWRAVGQDLRAIWDNNWALINGAISIGIDQAKYLLTALVNWIWELFTKTDWLKLGQNIIEGIAGGIKFATQWLIDANINTLKAVLETIKGFLGIASPSKVFKMQVGYQMGAGLMEGWNLSMKTMTAGVPGSMEDVVAAAGIPAKVSGGLGGGMTVNYYDQAVVSSSREYEVAEKLGPAMVLKLRQLGVL